MVENLQNIRIGAIDFGFKRIGLAYTDEMHISLNTYRTINNDEKLWQNIEAFIKEQRIGAIVIGMPTTKDGKMNEIQIKIEEFSQILKDKYFINVFLIDEYGSSKTAARILLDSGVKKKKRSKKGAKDEIAACVILNNFINEWNVL